MTDVHSVKGMCKMVWGVLLVAGILEVVWASFLKYADSLLDWILILFLILISFLLLLQSYKKIPAAVAYTVFVGIGTAGTYFVGFFLGESFSFRQILFLLLLLAGITGMTIFTKEETEETRGDY